MYHGCLEWIRGGEMGMEKPRATRHHSQVIFENHRTKVMTQHRNPRYVRSTGQSESESSRIAPMLGAPHYHIFLYAYDTAASGIPLLLRIHCHLAY